MSGLEAVAAIGMLCNAMTIVTFARDALQVARQIKDGGPDSKLQQYLQKAKQEYKELADQQQAAGQAYTEDEKKIFQTGKDCYDCLQKLDARYQQLLVDQGSRGLRRRWQILIKTSKTLWSAEELAGYERDFARYDNLLAKQLLSRIMSQQDLTSLKQSDTFQKLDEKIQRFVVTYDEGVTNSEQLVKADGALTRQRIAEAAENNRKMHEQAVVQKHEEESRKRLLNSLWNPDMNARKNQIGDRYPDTFRWIFRHYSKSSYAFDDISKPSSNELITWLKSGTGLFWISGKPASGKSTLMRYIADSWDTQKCLNQGNIDTLRISHYFWKPQDTTQRTIRGMLSSFIFQLLSAKPHLHENVGKYVRDVGTKISPDDWHITELEPAFLGIIATIHRPVCIFIDALDEAADIGLLLDPNDGGQSLLKRILAIDGVRICVSSRDEPMLRRHLENSPTIFMQDLTKADMRTFARGRLLNCETWEDDFRPSLIDSLLRKADGVFLWLVLAIESLNRGINNNDDAEILRKRLDTMPQGLHQLFGDMLSRQGEDAGIYRSSASLFFKITLVLARLLPSLRSFYPTDHYKQDLATLSVVADGDFINRFVQSGPGWVTIPYILNMMNSCQQKLLAHCAGLFDLRPQKSLEADLHQSLLQLYFLHASPPRDITFIHRSVLDFLQDTQEGIDLMKRCHVSESEIKRRLAISILVLGSLDFDPRQMTGGSFRRLRDSINSSVGSWHFAFRRSALRPAVKLVLTGPRGDRKVADQSLLDTICRWQKRGYFQRDRDWDTAMFDDYFILSNESLIKLDLFQTLVELGLLQTATTMLDDFDCGEFCAAIVLAIQICWQHPGHQLRAMLSKVLEQLHVRKDITTLFKSEVLKLTLIWFISTINPTYSGCLRPDVKKMMNLVQKVWRPDSFSEILNHRVLVCIMAFEEDEKRRSFLHYLSPVDITDITRLGERVAVYLVSLQFRHIMQLLSLHFGLEVPETAGTTEVYPKILLHPGVGLMEEEFMPRGLVSVPQCPLKTSFEKHIWFMLVQYYSKDGFAKLDVAQAQHYYTTFSSVPGAEIFTDMGKALEYIHEQGCYVHPWQPGWHNVKVPREQRSI